MTYIIFLIITTLLHILLLNKANNISNFISLFDYPDNIRKFQTKPVPLIGGIILCFILFLNLMFLKIFNLSFKDNIFIYFFPLITLIGFLDDKFDLSANLKFLITIFFFIIFFYFNQYLTVQELRFSSFTTVINITQIISFSFTILCCLLLINSINMIDGKNGLCTSIQLIILSLLSIYIMRDHYIEHEKIKLLDENLIIIFLYFLFLLIFLFLNLRGSIFLGDSGAFLGSFIIIYLILNIYSKDNSIFKCEQIFFLLILPGIDMLRVFIYRILNKKNPFIGDNQHLHHLLEKKFDSHKKITFIMSLCLLIPNTMIMIFPNQTLLVLIIYLSIYILGVRYLHQLNYKNYDK